MPVVGSGSLFLIGQEDNKSIAFEVFGNVTGSNITLHELSNLADLTGSNQGMSEFFGYQNQAPPETVTTDAVSNVGSTQGRFNGTVSVASGGVTSRGFKWMSGNQSTSTLISSGTEQTAGSGIGSFNYTKTGLSNLKKRYNLLSDLSPDFKINGQEYTARLPLILQDED